MTDGFLTKLSGIGYFLLIGAAIFAIVGGIWSYSAWEGMKTTGNISNALNALHTLGITGILFLIGGVIIGIGGIIGFSKTKNAMDIIKAIFAFIAGVFALIGGIIMLSFGGLGSDWNSAKIFIMLGFMLPAIWLIFEAIMLFVQKAKYKNQTFALMTGITGIITAAFWFIGSILLAAVEIRAISDISTLAWGFMLLGIGGFALAVCGIVGGLLYIKE